MTIEEIAEWLLVVKPYIEKLTDEEHGELLKILGTCDCKGE
jgi:hypothetical protein